VDGPQRHSLPPQRNHNGADFIVCLEAGLGATPGSVEQQLAEIRALRQSLVPQSFDSADIDAARREGRP
jgi:hypothetical protein